MKIRNIDYATRDYEGFRTSLIELLKQKIPEYTDFSQSDAGIVLIELLSHGLDILSYYEDVIANEVFLPTARERESVIKIANTLGYVLENAKPSKFMQVFEIEPKTYNFLIPKGTKISTTKSSVEEAIIFETDEDLIIPASYTGLEKNEQGEYRFAVPITQGVSVTNEILGSSNGSVDQKFTFFNKPVIDDSVEIFVNEGSGYRKWNKISTFLDSNTERPDYTLEVDESDNMTVNFGNNISGKIPKPYTNGILTHYRIGGGTIGNVAPNTITEMNNVLAGVKSTFNPTYAYQLGTDKETLESAKIKAPRSLRVLNRAVTEEDYKDIILLEKFIKQANSKFDKLTGQLDLVALPISGKTLSDEQLRSLNDILDSKGIMGQKFTIKQPTYTPITLTINVIVDTIASNSLTKQLIEDRLTKFFSIGSIPFDYYLSYSKITNELNQIPSIQKLDCTGLTKEGNLGFDTLPELTQLNVVVTGGAE